jgi:hypothetical protein
MDLIDSIYATIDDIIGPLGKEGGVRFLVIGDFLHSLHSAELSDPAEIILKTSRSAYLGRIKLRSFINAVFGYGIENYMVIHQKLLIGLRISNILSKSMVRVKSTKGWNTTIYFRLNTGVNMMGVSRLIHLSRFPFILSNVGNEEYSIGSFRSVWKMKRRRREMVDVPICNESIIRANQVSFMLSSVLVKSSRAQIENEKHRLLSSVNCESMDEYFAKLRRILEDDLYIREVFRGRKEIKDVKYNDLIVLKREVKAEYISVINIFQKIMSMVIVDQDIFDKPIFLPCFADNRGRQYYASLLSPTFYILFRYLYEMTEKKNFRELTQSTFYKRLMKHREIVGKFKLPDLESYIAIILFIEVGKFFIKGKGEHMITTENIITAGIEQYTANNLNIEFDDMLYLTKIYCHIKMLIKGERVDHNTLIFKDATASGLQNYGIILGYKEEKLKYLNIDNDDWCDTYQYIINMFLEDTTGKLSKRKYWKSTIMTIPYNSTWYSCFVKFIEAIGKDGHDYARLDTKEQDELKTIHKRFYDKIKHNIKEELYEKKEERLQVYRYKKWEVVSVEDYKINYRKARDKYRNTMYEVVDDEASTLRSLEANSMHHLDAKLVKAVLKKFDVLTIHDCFGIRLCELHMVMDEINNYYSEVVGRKTYSAHIII